MLKLFIKIILFSVLFIVMLGYTDELFKEKNISSLSRKIYKKIDKNVDIAIFGSSHGQNGIDPRLLEKDLQKTVYNFATIGQRLVSTIPTIDEILTDNDVELAIVDIFSGTIRSLTQNQKKALYFQYYAMDNLDLSIPKIKAYCTLFRTDMFNIFPTIRRHHKWSELVDGIPNELDKNTDFYNGYYANLESKKEYFDKSVSNAKKIKNRNIIIEDLTKDERNNIDKLINKIKKFKVRVLYISTPFYVDSLGQRFKTQQQLVINYLKEKGVSFIDFNELWGELNLLQKDFTDVGHLNTKGALKVSNYLSNYICDNYNFNENVIKQKDNYVNRYSIIDNDYDKILYKKSFDNVSRVNYIGLEKIYFFKAYKNRYEILFEGNLENFNSFTVQYKYEYESVEKNIITENQKKRINKNGIVTQKAKIDNGFMYNDKKYQIFQFYSVFDKLINFKLYVINKNKRIEIINLDELNLINANR